MSENYQPAHRKHEPFAMRHRRGLAVAAGATVALVVAAGPLAKKIGYTEDEQGIPVTATTAPTTTQPTPRESVTNIANICAIYPNAQIEKDFGVPPIASENQGGVEGEATNCQIGLGKIASIQIDVNCSKGAEFIWTEQHRGYGEQIITGGNPQADGAYIHPPAQEKTWYAGARATKPNGDLCVVELTSPYTMAGVSAEQMKQKAIIGLGHAYRGAVEQMGLVVPPEEPGLLKLVND